MGNLKQNMVDPDRFDYPRLHEDLRVWCKKNKKDLQTISQDVFYRTGSYVSNGLSKKNLPLNVLMKLIELIGADAKQYEIVPKPEPEPAPVVQEQPAPSATALTGNGWEVAARVDLEFGTAMIKVMKNGEEVAIGRSYLYGKNDTDIVKSLSYASHMAYKVIQQRQIADRGYQQVADIEEAETEMAKAEQEEPEPTIEEMASRRLPFKDWVKRYAEANSAYGKCARYIGSHYPHFPATSEKKMRYYLRLNGGETHLQTFDVLFAMYRNQDRQQYAENSRLK